MTKSKDAINVLDLLESQHREVDQLIEELEGGKGDPDETFEELANKLAAHATIEEEIFYPAIVRPETEDMLREAVEEHLSVKRLLADMLELDTESEEFTAKLSVLKEQLEHHAHEEEEDKLFPKLRKLIPADQLRALGNECLVRFEELMHKHPADHLAAETDHAAPLS